jgi:glyoxylase-like metal-dependent hydrolase (beta-lactamase superfamily II)
LKSVGYGEAPVRFVNTHWHGDHTEGNGKKKYFGKDTTIIAHVNVPQGGLMDRAG